MITAKEMRQIADEKNSESAREIESIEHEIKSLAESGYYNYWYDSRLSDEAFEHFKNNGFIIIDLTDNIGRYMYSFYWGGEKHD